MPRFIIERVVPGAGKMTPDELKAMSTRSCNVISSIGPKIQWIHSYVTDNKIYCIYIAPDEETIREHARQGGFPANQINVIGRMIDPTTAES